MSSSTVGTSPAIRVRDVHKAYGDVQAVDGVSFEVEHGEVFGLLGPNGAGKTTTVEMLEGLREPDGGELTVLGLDATRHGRRSRRGSASPSRPRRSTRS